VIRVVNLIFFPQEQYFSQQFQVLLVSLRGHGALSTPAHPNKVDFTVEQLACDRCFLNYEYRKYILLAIH
jgi:hypothetical protein